MSLEDYKIHGGLVALQRALTMTPLQICDEVTESGLVDGAVLAFRPG